jgi:hypothetical protein
VDRYCTRFKDRQAKGKEENLSCPQIELLLRPVVIIARSKVSVLLVIKE